MKEGIKAIIFDVGGVLAIGGKTQESKGKVYTQSLHSFVANKLKIPLDQYFDSIDSTYANAIVGKYSKKKALKILSKNFNISPLKLEKIYKAGYKNLFKQNMPLHKKASELKKEGYKIAILSDQWYISYEVAMPKKLYDKFDKKVVSCFDKIRKPDLGAYNLILKKLRLKPEQTIFIDNQEWNLTPAKELGITTILFKNNNQFFKDLKKLGV